MKVGIVVPYSWSFWGAVVEHAELQADALRRLGIETRTVMGNDPVGSFTRVLHPRLGRGGSPPPDVIPVGRSVIVPANGSLPNIVLSPRTVGRIARTLERENFDVVHVHEPLAPVIGVATLAQATCPIVTTFHSAGKTVRWTKLGVPLWGFLLDRVDARIAVSEAAAATAKLYAPGDYEVIPNGVLIPPEADAGDREHTVLFVGRQERRKGLPVLLRAWPDVHRRTGATLKIIGADPLAVRLLTARSHNPAGIEVLGFLSQEELTAELLGAKVMAAPSLGGESFGMVLTRAFACATPVVASDIQGYRDVMSNEAGLLVPPDDPQALADALVELLGDEQRRRVLGANARLIAQKHYDWDGIARRLVGIYERVLEREPTAAVAA